MANGLLFIGDLHLSSTRPGRRQDNYAEAVLNKLQQAAHIANQKNLQAVCLGDFFHRPEENDLQLISRVMTVLRSFNLPLIVLAGSHDRVETQLTARDALALLQSAGCLQVVDQPGQVLTAEMNGTPVALWAAPAGTPIPTMVPALPGGVNLLITHHDFDFAGRYPDAIELREVENCDMLINGHMHTPAPSVVHGKTVCFNPGSVGRPSVDLRMHRPAVHAWYAGSGYDLEALPLVAAEGTAVFDMTGKNVSAADDKTLKASLGAAPRLSQFASILSAGDDSLAAGRTDDASVLQEELADYFAEKGSSPALRNYLGKLLDSVIRDRAPS